MKRFLVMLVVLFGLFLFFRTIDKSHTTTFKEPPIVKPVIATSVDIRIASLNKFFETYKCPKPYYVEDYIRYANQDHIDYRLLPSISIAESTCGEHEIKNNWWGWQSGKGNGFNSVPSGIEFLSKQLESNHYYLGKTNYQKLRSYNPNPSYAQEVLKLINSIK